MKARPGILFLLALTIISGGTQQVLPQNSGIPLEGRVLRLGTSAPIPNAEIFLVGMNPNLPDTVTPSNVINAAQLFQTAATAATDSQKRLLERTAASLAEDVSPELLRPTFTAMGVSDSMGNFRFANLTPGRYSLRVSNEGFFALVADVMDNSPLAFTNAISADLRPNGEFEIRNVPSGRYDLYPAYRAPIPSSYLQRVFTT